MSWFDCMTVYYTIYIGSYNNSDGMKLFNKTDSAEFNTSDKQK